MKNFLFLVLILISCQIFGQKSTLSGIITDRKTGETLVGATVLLKGDVNRGTSTDLNGFFSLLGIDKEKAEVEFSFIGYETLAREFNMADQNKLFVEIKLSPSEIQLAQVTIVETGADKLGDREIEISQHTLTPKAIQSIPSARNDVFKAIQYLPGVESTEPFSPLVSVRGSDPGENQIMLDGVTMYNPYHFLSSSGTFNMQTVKEVDILAGGFGAEFGGRNSSVINIATKDGDQSGLHGEVHPTTSETKLFLEFPVGEKTTMMVAGRINYDLIGNFMYYSKNYFYDANLSLTHRFNARNRITLKYFSSKDRTNLDFNSIYKYMGNSLDQFSDDEIDYSEIFNTMSIKWINQWNNNLATAIWKSVLSPKLYLRAQVSASLHRANNFSELVMDFEDVVFNTSTRFNSKVNDYTAKLSLNYNLSYWNTLKFGAEYSNYLFSNETELNKVETETASRNTSLVSYYAEDKIKFGKLIIRTGVRVACFDNGEYLFEPRVNIVLGLPGDWKIQAAWGKYNQYIVSMNTQEFEFNQFLDYYYPLTGKLPSQSFHYILGAEKIIHKNHTLSIDLYYKNISRTYTFDLLQSQYEAFALSDKIVEGTGATYGAELMWKGNFGKISGWGSYTLAKSTRSFPNIMNGKTYNYDYDRRHSFKGVVNFQATKRISYSAAFKAQSGAPRSVENTFQMYYMYEPLTGTIAYSPQYTVNMKNATRMPWLLYLDLGLQKKVVSGFGKDLARFFKADESYFTLNVYNVLFFRRNILYYMPIEGWDKYIPMGDNYLPMVSAGYTIKF